MEKNRQTKGNNSIKLVYHNFFYLVILLIFVLIFFARLFYPQSSLFMIPDFGESDILHFNLPLKEILSVSLKNKEWPLWTSHLASGFPLLAEGQIGTFYLPNLVLFRFLPTITAYNLSLVISYLLSGLGTFFFTKSLKLSSITCLFSALIFTFSGFLSVHLNHFNLIQAASLLPFLFWAVNLILKKPSIRYAILFAFFLSQQIFTGHFYIVFISLIGITIFFWGSIALDKHYKIYKNSKKLFKKSVLSSRPTPTLRRGSGGIFHIPKVGRFLDPDLIGARNDTFQTGSKRIGYLLLGFLLGFCLSAIQLLPTFELIKLSGRAGGLPFETVTSYPYPFKHLITFINPYALGNPVDSSYPPYDANWGIFWENTAYVGILPLILVFLSVFFYWKKEVKIFLILSFFSLLLVLGKYSPIYLIFSFPPFNFFRVPSKFLLLTTFSLAVLSGHTFEQIVRYFNSSTPGECLRTPPVCFYRITTHKIFSALVICILFLLVLLDEYRFSYNYPPVSPANWWTQIPESARFLQKKDGRITSIGAPLVWNNVFLKKGWQDVSPFVYFRNSLYPNYNVLFHISNVDINTGGLTPKRLSIFTSLTKTAQIDEERKEASASAALINTLSLASVSYLTSPYEIKEKELVLVEKIPSPDVSNLLPFYIYKNTKALPYSYLSFKTKQIKTLEDYYRELQKEDFLSQKKTLVEDDSLAIFEVEPRLCRYNNVDITFSDDTQVKLKSHSDCDSLLVLTDTHYPGWLASIDNQPVGIKNVNLTQRGIFLPKGLHNIRFVYQPISFKIGKLITLASSAIVFLVMFLSRGFFPQKASGKKMPSLHL